MEVSESVTLFLEIIIYNYLQNVSKIYETEDNSTLAVNDVSFQVLYGSFIGIMGASSSGKTTLLNLIATIDKPTSGIIEINGKSNRYI